MVVPSGFTQPSVEDVPAGQTYAAANAPVPSVPPVPIFSVEVSVPAKVSVLLTVNVLLVVPPAMLNPVLKLLRVNPAGRGLAMAIVPVVVIVPPVSPVPAVMLVTVPEPPPLPEFTVTALLGFRFAITVPDV